jgi:hypothetical protein
MASRPKDLNTNKTAGLWGRSPCSLTRSWVPFLWGGGFTKGIRLAWYPLGNILNSAVNLLDFNQLCDCQLNNFRRGTVVNGIPNLGIFFRNFREAVGTMCWCARRQWRTGQGVSLPDGKWAPLNIRQYVKNVNDLLVA